MRLKTKRAATFAFLFFILFSCDGMVEWFVPNFLGGSTLRNLTLMLCFAIAMVAFVRCRIGNKFLEKHMLLFGLYFFFLIGESFIRYDSPWINPHTLLYLFPVVCTTSFFVILKRTDSETFLRVFAYVLSGVIYAIEVVKRAQGLQPEDIGRVAPSALIFLLLFLTMYFCAVYAMEMKFRFLFLIMINVAIIILENHRTVWSSGIVAMAIFVLLSGRKTNLARLRRWGTGAVIFIFACCLFLLTGGAGKYIQFIQGRFSEIPKYKEVGTGAWRYKQYEYYMTYIKERPLFGMRFQARDVPPLYVLTPGTEATGHHFHSGFLAVLFYHGLFGFYLLYGPLIYYLFSFLRQKEHSTVHMALFSFLVGGAVYSFGYRQPFYFFCLLGVGFVLLEREREGRAMSEKRFLKT